MCNFIDYLYYIILFQYMKTIFIDLILIIYLKKVRKIRGLIYTNVITDIIIDIKKIILPENNISDKFLLTNDKPP